MLIVIIIIMIGSLHLLGKAASRSCVCSTRLASTAAASGKVVKTLFMLNAMREIGVAFCKGNAIMVMAILITWAP
jgi:hypothetical protein